jgi:hypothetical protein
MVGAATISARGSGARGARRAGAIALLALCAPSTACAASPPSPASPPPPSVGEWQLARRRLAVLRGASARPRTERIALRLREPVTGRVLEARGAVAIAPPRALRMILLGPGGSTALDLWIDGDRYRFAVPALDLVKRGDAATPREARRGLPVDFLRFWLLRPAEGELLFAAREGSADRLVLRDGDAIVDLVAHDGGRVTARRGSWSSPRAGEPARRIDEETVDASLIVCGSVRYHQASTGLNVQVTCEGTSEGAPSPRAFADPDAEASP